MNNVNPHILALGVATILGSGGLLLLPGLVMIGIYFAMLFWPLGPQEEEEEEETPGPRYWFSD